MSVEPRPSDQFVRTPQVEEVVERALAYLGAGYPVNLAGPAGTGKTTLALHLATRRGQPVALVHGDDEYGGFDPIGGDQGDRRSKLVDNFIRSAGRTEETLQRLGIDACLTTACRYGHTLVYDEFTRSRPEANNALLRVLGEGLLSLPTFSYSGEGYLKVHPNFRAIFTSTPNECAGAHARQDAILDRLITIHTDHYDRETEIAITASKSGIAPEDAARIVDVVRSIRRRKTAGHGPSILAAIIIACAVAHRCDGCDRADPLFRAVCCDVLSVGAGGGKALASEEIHAAIDELDLELE